MKVILEAKSYKELLESALKCTGANNSLSKDEVEDLVNKLDSGDIGNAEKSAFIFMSRLLVMFATDAELDEVGLKVHIQE